MNCDAKNEQTYQRCHGDKIYPDASLGRVNKDVKTGEEQGEGKVNEQRLCQGGKPAHIER